MDTTHRNAIQRQHCRGSQLRRQFTLKITVRCAHTYPGDHLLRHHLSREQGPDDQRDSWEADERFPVYHDQDPRCDDGDRHCVTYRKRCEVISFVCTANVVQIGRVAKLFSATDCQRGKRDTSMHALYA